MSIRMKKTVRGSPDGADVRVYAEGEEHDLSRTPRERELAEVFLREGWAVDVAEPEEKDLGPAPEDKDLGRAPENKDLGAASENKRRRGR